jgi:uncharacterized membrane protein YkgB
MLATLYALAVPLAVNPNGAKDWATSNIVPLIFLFLGIVFLAGAKKQEWGKLASTIGVMIVALSFITYTTGWVNVSEAVSNAFLGG